MAVTSATSVTSAETTTGISSATSQVSADAFITLLVAELQNQDPLSPMDNEAMLNQLAQITSVAELSKLNANFTRASGIELAAQVGSLVGRTVEWEDPNTGAARTAEVTSVQLSGGAWVLNAGEDQVPLDSIVAIS